MDQSEGRCRKGYQDRDIVKAFNERGQCFWGTGMGKVMPELSMFDHGARTDFMIPGGRQGREL